MIPLITSSDHVIPTALVDPGRFTINFSDKLYHVIDNHLGTGYCVAMVIMCVIAVPSNGVLTVIATATAVTSSQSTVNDNSEYHMMSHDLTLRYNM